MLEFNGALVKLELDENLLGPRTAQTLAAALRRNRTLQFLSLESNDLTLSEAEPSGALALGEMLAHNASLTHLSLWRTRLSSRVGEALADGVCANDFVTFVELGGNMVQTRDERRVADRCASRRARDPSRSPVYARALASTRVRGRAPRRPARSQRAGSRRTRPRTPRAAAPSATRGARA